MARKGNRQSQKEIDNCAKTLPRLQGENPSKKTEGMIKKGVRFRAHQSRKQERPYEKAPPRVKSKKKNRKKKLRTSGTVPPGNGEKDRILVSGILEIRERNC